MAIEFGKGVDSPKAVNDALYIIYADWRSEGGRHIAEVCGPYALTAKLCCCLSASVLLM